MKRNLTLMLAIGLMLTLAGYMAAFTVQGQVFDQQTNAAISGAEVELGGMYELQTQTDDAGAFIFTDVPQGMGHLDIHAEGYNHFQQMLQINQDLTLTCGLMPNGEPPASYTLSGVVTNQDGEPQHMVPLQLSADIIVAAAVTNMQGEYEFHHLAAGTYTLQALNPQDPANPIAYEATIELTGDMQFDIVLEGTGGGEGTCALSGIVTDSAALLPISGVEIHIEGHHGMNGGGEATTVSDDTGAYSFTTLNPGMYEIEVELQGYHHFHRQVMVSDATVQDIALDPYVQGEFTLSGVVTSSTDGSALPNLFIQLHGQEFHMAAQTADDGSYLFEGLAAGEYHLFIGSDHPCQPLYEETLTITESTVHNITLGLTVALTTLSGVVTDSTGVALAGVDLALFGPPMYGFYQGQATTDDTGAYLFEQVPDEAHLHLVAHMDGYQSFMQNVDINGPTVLNITLGVHEQQPMTVVSGVVTYDEDGSPVAGAMIHLVRVAQGEGHHGPHMDMTLTDDTGAYEINAPAGEYYALCMIGGPDAPAGYMEFYDNALTIEEATPLTLEENVAIENINFGVPMNPATVGAAGSYVTGLVIDLNGDPVQNASVTVRDEQGNALGTVATDAQGMYQVDETLSGSVYTVEAQTQNSQSTSAEFTHEGLVSVVNLEFANTAQTENNIPSAGILSARNEPNPFNPQTSILLNMPATASVKLNVYNARGQLIRTLVDGQLYAGSHSITWNGTDNNGRAVSSGLYFYRVDSQGQSIVRKMALLK